MDNKILAFPTSKIVREAPVDELENKMLKYREKGQYKYAEAVTQELVGNLYENIEEFEIDMEDEVFVKDFNICADMIRAAVYRASGVHHHLHNFLDKSVIVKSVDDITEAEIDIAESEMGIVNE